MTLLDAFWLGLMQGITEFLPISSDGHLVLLESWLKLPLDELKAFDVVLHLGTLIAMVIYFWNDLWSAVKNVKLAGWIVVGSIPAVVAGLTLEDWIDATFREATVVYGMLMVMGVFYLIVEAIATRRASKSKAVAPSSTELSLGRVVLIGIAQAFALIQGISRSGSTIGTGLLLGLSREKAARFSFVLGTPVIAGAVALKSLQVVQGEASLPAWDITLVGLLTSLIAGYGSVAFLMKFLKKHSLNFFAVYLFVVAGIGLMLARG